jgi:hypothetical protein
MRECTVSTCGSRAMLVSPPASRAADEHLEVVRSGERQDWKVSLRGLGAVSRPILQSKALPPRTQSPVENAAKTGWGTRQFVDRLECCGNPDVSPEAIYGEPIFVR